MHTLTHSAGSPDLFDVIFLSDHARIIIEHGLIKEKALKLVNYLNGGNANMPPVHQDVKGSYTID